MRRAILVMGLVLLVGAPAQASNPAVYSSSHGGGCVNPAFRTLERITSCGHEESTDGNTGTISVAIASPGDGAAPGRRQGFSRATYFAVDTLDAAVDAVTYTATVHVDEATVDRAGLIGDGGAGVWATLFLHHQSCVCSQWTKIPVVLTSGGEASVDDVTLTITTTLAAPQGQLAAGSVYLWVEIQGVAQIADVDDSLSVATGTAGLDAAFEVVGIAGPA